MMQRRTESIMLSIEPGLADIIKVASDHEGISKSSWLRKIAIDKLLKDGLLTNEMLLRITEG